LIFLPLALNAWSVNANEGDPSTAFANFPANTRELLKIFTIWKEDWPGALTDGALLFLGALVVMGVLLPWRAARDERNHTPGRLFRTVDQAWLLICLGLPWLIGNLLLSRTGSVFREDRYLIFLAPFVLWAVARGVTALGARGSVAGWLAGGAVVILLAATLPRLWTPVMFRENWRAAAEYIHAYQVQSPGLRSGAVAHINYTHQPLDWYLRQHYTMDELPVWGLFGDPLTPAQIETVIAPPLRGIVEWGAHTLWLTQSHLQGVDDARLVEGWLDANFPLITEQYPDGVKLTGYALQSHFETLPELAANAVHADATLAPGLTLAACEVTTPTVSATDEELHPPSGWVHVRLWWQAAGPVTDDYQVVARVVGPGGVWGEKLDRGVRELSGHLPPSAWPARGFMRDEHDINLNPITPAGEYRVVIGLQNGAGNPLDAMADCGPVQIEP
jgi:hypothetical protein